MTARSVVLSVLLGAHPAWATVAELLLLTSDFGIRESTVRVALTRMVAAGDLVRSEDGYRLSDRLLARQRRQDDALNPHRRPWDGTWTVVLITSVGTEARTRAALRNMLQNQRFGELREGVWMRPDNVAVDLGDECHGRVRVLRATDAAPVELAMQLWDLSAWAKEGRDLLAAMGGAADVPGRFAIAAAMVRHLLTDPVLPDELLPDDWPGGPLRVAYRDFAAELVARRDGVRLAEVVT
ncbi:MAG: PaaX family transcriptional regulator C-terminal domain-containing protein [Mycolicibacterium sp.]|uniref:PaaX family transcriptional regulator C-terminal domain-containing protein n=1 Tax=Mycolicibacterium sp. TaxID=2320850 RepID=UPI003D0E1D0D